MITNLLMELFEALVSTYCQYNLKHGENNKAVMKKLVKRILLVPVTLLVLNILVIRHMAPGGGGWMQVNGLNRST